MPDSPPPSRTAEFVPLFAANSRRIYSYILTLIPRSADADEVFQETSSVLWAKFNEFETGTNFGAWACRVAYFQALKFIKSHRGDRLVFDESFLEAADRQLQTDSPTFDARHDALGDCLAALPERDRELITARYAEALDVPRIAARFDKSPNAVYKLLSRIHRDLLACITRRTGEDRP